MRNVLITGGCGFVGSTIAISLKRKRPEFNIICLDNLKRRGSELNISRLKLENINYIHGDVRISTDLEINEKIDLIIDCSAEPSVMAGVFESPNYLVSANLKGTLNCLELARKEKSSLIFLSTSRVYPISTLLNASIVELETRFDLSENQKIAGITKQGISELMILDGNKTLYGATKLASEIMIQEYSNVYGLNTIINRCGLLAGPWQFGKIDQGVIVLWVASHYWKKNLSYIGFGGSGKQVRDVLHVNDLCVLIENQINRIGEFHGEVYNIGGGRGNSISLLELSKLTESIVGNKLQINSEEKTRNGDIPIYITDNSLTKKTFGWKPSISIESLIFEIHEWIKTNENLLKEVLN